METHTHTHTHTHKHTKINSLAHSPHIDKASAQEWVQVPVYAGQTGDVEDFMTQA